MSVNRIAAVAITTCIVASAVVGTATAADAATASPRTHVVTHYAHARADWRKSSRVAAAEQNRYLAKADRQLANYGKRFAHQRKELRTLESIPLTDTTPKQRATAKRVVHQLNLFFRPRSR